MDGITNDSTAKLRLFFDKHKHLFFLLLAGVLLLGLHGNGSPEEISSGTAAEQRLKNTLEHMEGVGKTCVLLAESCGREESYTGAVIVCAGAGDPKVRLEIVEAVSAFTGLGSNHITVMKMNIQGG